MNKIQRTILFDYTERNVIPPRCRKPRDISGLRGETVVEFVEVNPADFLLAITVEPLGWDKDKPPLDYYWYDGRLWVHTDPVIDRSVCRIGGCQSSEQQIAEIQEWARDLIVVGDEFYRAAETPCYEVNFTFFGTYIRIASANADNIFSQRLFPANQLNQALAFARGNSRQEVDQCAALKVHLPEAAEAFYNTEWAAQARQTQIELTEAGIQNLHKELDQREADLERLNRIGVPDSDPQEITNARAQGVKDGAVFAEASAESVAPLYRHFYMQGFQKGRELLKRQNEAFDAAVAQARQIMDRGE